MKLAPFVRVFAAATLLLSSPFAQAGAYNWSSISPAPGPTSTVTIPVNTVCYLDVTTITVNSIVVNGTLVFNNMPVHLTAKNIDINNGGVMQVGTKTIPASGTVITLTGQGGTENVIEVHGGGRLELHGDSFGATKCWTQLSGTVAVGQSSFNVTSAMPWNSGDTVVMASTDFMYVSHPTLNTDAFQDQTESFTISRVSPTSYNLSGSAAAFVNSHFGGFVGSGQTVDERAEVGLVNRSLRVEGSGIEHGTILLTREPTSGPAPELHCDWTEFTALGSRKLTRPNSFGSYPIHFHNAGDVSGSYVQYCSLHHNHLNNIVIHNTSNLEVRGNVLFDTVGYHVWTQDHAWNVQGLLGAKYPSGWQCTGNQIVDNLAMVAREDATSEGVVDEDDPNGYSALGNAACFYLKNWYNKVDGNHAASSWASGFYASTLEHYDNPSVWDTYLPYHEWKTVNGGTTSSFANNVAHSCADHGFYLGGYTEFSLDERTTGGIIVQGAHFENFTAYKNNGFGFHCRNMGYDTWPSARLADNGAGVYLASAGWWIRDGQSWGNITGGVIVGRSTGTAGTSANYGMTHNAQESAFGRSVASRRYHSLFPYITGDLFPSSRLGELTGISMYDGLVDINGVAFESFDLSNQPIDSSKAPPTMLKAGAFSPAAFDNPWAVDARNRAHNCTFLSTDNKMYFRPYAYLASQPNGQASNGTNNTVLYDTSHCILPSANANTGVLFPLNNTLMALANPLATNNSAMNIQYVDSNTQPFAQAVVYAMLNVTNPIPSDMLVTMTTKSPPIVTGNDSLRPSFANGGWWLYPWSTPVSATGTATTPENVLGSIPTPGHTFSGPLVAQLSDNATGSVADFAIPYSGGMSGIRWASKFSDAVDGIGTTPVPFAAHPFGTNDATVYNYNASAQVLHLRIKLGSGITRIAVSPQLNAFATFSGETRYVYVY